MEKITKEEYDSWLAKDKEPEKQLEYIKGILKPENGKIYGKVVGEHKKTLFVKPYIQGKRVRILLDEGDRWGIALYNDESNISSEDNKIVVTDYIKGDLVFGVKGPQIVNVEKFESEKSFRSEVGKLLRKKWKNEDFIFTAEDIVGLDEKMFFTETAPAKVEAMLDEYEARIRDKIDEEEKKLADYEAKEKKRLHALQDEAAYIQAETDRLKAEQQEEQDALVKLKDQIEEAEKKRQSYIDLGIISKDEEQPNDREKYVYTTYEQLVNDVWGYLWKKKNLYYERSTVRYFMNALRTQQLTLLWGRPGTGKTSLPRAVAEALGAECVRVQVQSNWTDNQDLLGFYNIVDKRYVSTQFMDALVEAAKKKNQKKLYIILLDEMNLSNVEYYFSEMLNVFTWDEEYTLHLYSRHLYSKERKENAEKELENLKKQGKDFSDLKDIVRDMSDYKPEFTIPKNVRFVGTLNTDATTKTISPKVIDRSCLIELQTISRDTKEKEEQELPEISALDGKNWIVGADWFEIKKSQPSEDRQIRWMIDEIREKMKMMNVGLSVSNRIDSYIDQWTGWDDNCVEPYEIVLEKILPIIDIENNEASKKFIEELKEILKEILEDEKYKKFLAKIERMKKQAKVRITYWEN